MKTVKMTLYSPAILLRAVFLAAILALGMAACDRSAETDSTNGSKAEAEPAAQADEQSPEQVAEKSEPSASAAEACTLVMGWDPWMPYQYRAASGSVTGMDIEIASAAAAAAGCALETREASWVQHLQALEAGEINFVGGASKTPAREEFAWFTVPYRAESFVLFVDADGEDLNETSLKEVLDSGLTVGTVAGFYYGGAVAELQESGNYDGQFTDADISELNFRALAQGEVDAVLEDPYVGAAILRTEGLDDEIIESPVVLSEGEVSFMFSKEGTDREAFERFNKALQGMQESGALESILNRYRE